VSQTRGAGAADKVDFIHGTDVNAISILAAGPSPPTVRAIVDQAWMWARAMSCGRGVVSIQKGHIESSLWGGGSIDSRREVSESLPVTRSWWRMGEEESWVAPHIVNDRAQNGSEGRPGRGKRRRFMAHRQLQVIGRRGLSRGWKRLGSKGVIRSS